MNATRPSSAPIDSYLSAKRQIPTGPVAFGYRNAYDTSGLVGADLELPSTSPVITSAARLGIDQHRPLTRHMSRPVDVAQDIRPAEFCDLGQPHRLECAILPLHDSTATRRAIRSPNAAMSRSSGGHRALAGASGQNHPWRGWQRIPAMSVTMHTVGEPPPPSGEVRLRRDGDPAMRRPRDAGHVVCPSCPRAQSSGPRRRIEFRRHSCDAARIQWAMDLEANRPQMVP